MNRNALRLLRNAFAIDLRCLGLFRIGVGFTLLWDLYYRFGSLEDFYTDNGVSPRVAIIENSEEIWRYSFHMASGAYVYQFALFALLFVSSLCLLAGYRTRLATILTWVLVCSHQARNFAVNHGGDDAIRHLLFWLMFLPAGVRFSLDARNRDESPWVKDVFSVASAAILLQIIAIYFFSAIEKWHPIWMTEASALYYAFQADHVARPFAQWLLQFPKLLTASTWFVWRLELLTPLLAFWPWRNRWLRIILCLTMVAMHLGIALTLDIGLFPLTCAVAWLLFLPDLAGDQFENLAGKIWRASRMDGAREWLRAKCARFRACASSFESSAMSRESSIAVSRCRARRRFAGSLVLLALIALMIWSNIETVLGRKHWIPEPVRAVVFALALDQQWKLFAPYPFTDGGWYVVPGKRFNGEQIDLFRGGQPVSWEKPAVIHRMYKDPLWQKFMMGIWLKDNIDSRLYYARSLCRKWNDDLKYGDPHAIDTIEIYYVLENTPPPDKPQEKPEPIRIWEHFCFSKPKAPPASGN